MKFVVFQIQRGHRWDFQLRNDDDTVVYPPHPGGFANRLDCLAAIEQVRDTDINTPTDFLFPDEKGKQATRP